MTKKQWKTLGEIAAGIDGGCASCIFDFTGELQSKFLNMDRESYYEGLRSKLLYSEDNPFMEDTRELLWGSYEKS